MRQLPIKGILALACLGLSGAPLSAQDAGNPFGGAAAGQNPFGSQPGGEDPGGAAAKPPPANPFGGQAPASDPFGGGAAPQPPASDPFGGGAPAAGPSGPGAPPAAGPSREPAEAEEQNPIVLTIRDANPTTPEELMFAVHALFEIGRTDEAKQYLAKLMAADPDRDQLESLLREYGSPFFLRLGEDHRMEPEGAEFAESVREAAHQAARDPDRLRQAISRLSSPNPAVRRIAIEQLRRADEAAVPPLLEALADPRRSAEHAAIRDAIVRIGAMLLPPMLGAAGTPDDPLRAQVHRVLGAFGSPRAIPLLAAPAADPQADAEVRQSARDALRAIVGRVPSEREALQYLVTRIREYYDGALPGPLDYEDQVTLWQWDSEQGTVVPRRYSASRAARAMAARLSADLLAFDPEDPAVRRLLLTALLDFAKTDAGLDQPLPQNEGSAFALAAAEGVSVVEDVLEAALDEDRAVAAMAAAEVLGAIGGVSLLAADDGRPRPLVRGLRHADRRVRLAAADAIMGLNPPEAYAGSSYLPQVLGYLASTVGSQRVLVAHPRIERSQTLIGMLNQLGYEADSATTGNGAFGLASENPDYEFVLLSGSLNDPAAAETLAMFRRDPRTADLPVGLMAREANMQRARETAELDPLCLAFPRPHDASLMAFQAGRLIELSGRRRVAYDERLDQAERALEHLSRLAAEPQRYAFYDLYRQQDAIQSALFTPGLSQKAAAILGMLGSPQAQRALVTLASRHAQPLEDRQAAAKAFAEATRDHGVLLTRGEILEQYQRYNRSETLGTGTQQVLGSILDSIERPSQQALANDPSGEAPGGR